VLGGWNPDNRSLLSTTTYLAVRVKAGKVANDDGNGQRNCEHTGERAECTDKHSVERLWSHVAVANSRHRHQRPPQSQRNTFKLVIRIILSGQHKSSLVVVCGRSLLLLLFVKAIEKMKMGK